MKQHTIESGREDVEEIASEMGAELRACDQAPPEAAAIIHAVERLSAAELVGTAPNGDPLVLVVPNGKDVHELAAFIDPLRDAPKRRKGSATLLDLPSFINHAARFMSPERSAIFAVRDATNPRLISMLDYHARGHAGTPSHCEHRGVYTFPLSEEWKRWTGSNKRAMGQADFAEFIEANILEVLPAESAGSGAADFAAKLGVTFASPQRMLEVSRNLTIKVTDRVAQAVTLQSGELQLSYVSTHTDEAGAPVKVPAAFLLGLPVFRSGEAFQVPARLRYRVKEGSVSWWYELHRSDRAFEIAVEDAAKQAAEETGLPLFFGTPEA